jgi:hypothetical protein
MKTTGMAGKRFICSAILATVLLVLASSVCAAQSVRVKPWTPTPMTTASTFYRWYLHELTVNHSPLSEQAALSRFVAKPLLAEISRSQATPNAINTDYFLQSQHSRNEWESHIFVAPPKINGNTASVVVGFGSRRTAAHYVSLLMVKEDSKWKIRTVRKIGQMIL